MYVQNIAKHTAAEHQQPMPSKEAARLSDTSTPTKKRREQPQSPLERLVQERKMKWEKTLVEAANGKALRNRTGARHALIKMATTPAEWQQLGELLHEHKGDLVASVLEEFATKSPDPAECAWAEQVLFDRKVEEARAAIETEGDDEAAVKRRDWGYHSLINLVASGKLDVEELADEFVTVHRNRDLRPGVRRRFGEVAEGLAPATALWFRDQLRPTFVGAAERKGPPKSALAKKQARAEEDRELRDRMRGGNNSKKREQQ